MKQKQKNQISRQEPNGCGKIILLSCKVFLLIVSIYWLYILVPAFYYAPGVQRFIDSIKQSSYILIPADKESDLIAFVCYPGVGGSTNLYTVYPDGSNLRLISESYSKSYYRLNWSPDGLWIALEMKDEGYWTLNRAWSYESYYSEIYRIRFDGLVSRRLTYNHVHDRNPRWSNDGSSIFFDANGLSYVSVNGGEIKQINPSDLRSSSLRPNRPSLSIVPNRTGDPSLNYSLHRDDSGLKLLTEPKVARHSQSYSWSPDSEWIAFSSSSYSQNSRLFKIKRDGTALQQLTDLDCRITEISWSPT